MTVKGNLPIEVTSFKQIPFVSVLLIIITEMTLIAMDGTNIDDTDHCFCDASVVPLIW